MPQNNQIWPKIGIWCPVGGLVGCCGAQAVSRKTPIYFILVLFYMGVLSMRGGQCQQMELREEGGAAGYFGGGAEEHFERSSVHF